MKINNPINRAPGVTGTPDVASGKPRASGPEATAAAGDKVNITPLSQKLRTLESKLADVSVVDGARVEAIKQAISEGRFNVNSEVVADRLIATVKEYLLSQKN